MTGLGHASRGSIPKVYDILSLPSATRHVAWDDQGSRVNSELQFQPHFLPTPDHVQRSRVPRFVQQQFYQQCPQHRQQHQTMYRHASYAAPPVYPQAMPEHPVPTSLHRPYSYYTGFDVRQYQVGLFRQQAHTIAQLKDAEKDLASLKTLTQLTPYDLEALKVEFQATTGKTLHDFCMNLVVKQKREVKTLVAGLTLGPIEFDMYLLKVSPALLKISNRIEYIQENG